MSEDWKELGPICLLLVDVHGEHIFDSAVLIFCKSIGLGVVRGREDALLLE